MSDSLLSRNSEERAVGGAVRDHVADVAGSAGEMRETRRKERRGVGKQNMRLARCRHNVDEDVCKGDDGNCQLSRMKMCHLRKMTQTKRKRKYGARRKRKISE